MSVQERTVHTGVADSVALLNSQAPCSGPQIAETWNCFLRSTYRNQSALSTNLVLKKELCCYESNLCHADRKDWIFHMSY